MLAQFPGNKPSCVQTHAAHSRCTKDHRNEQWTDCFHDLSSLRRSKPIVPNENSVQPMAHVIPLNRTPMLKQLTALLSLMNEIRRCALCKEAQFRTDFKAP